MQPTQVDEEEKLAEWKNTEPGVLALLGTSISIHLHKTPGFFAIYIGETCVGLAANLEGAKAAGERSHADLVEIGAE